MSKKNLSFRNGEENEKVSWNPHADPDHHQKLITSRGSYLTHACQVWSTFVSAFVSYPVYRMTQIENDHITCALLAKIMTESSDHVTSPCSLGGVKRATVAK